MPDETHLGQTASNLVLLQLFTIPNRIELFSFLRRLPDFTLVPSHSEGYPGYSPPEGQVLIITDVDWECTGRPGDAVNFTITLESLRDQPAGERWIPRPKVPVFRSALILGGNGYGVQSVAMTTGFVVPHGVRIDAQSGDPPNYLHFSGNLNNVILRGYLAPDK